jgi:hypothetical protein
MGSVSGNPLLAANTPLAGWILAAFRLTAIYLRQPSQPVLSHDSQA